MKKVFLMILIVLVCVGSFQVFNNRPQSILMELQKKDLLGAKRGIGLQYTVYFMGVVPMANILISQEDAGVYEGKDAIKMTMIAKPLSPLFDFYKGRVELVSLIDKKKEHALKFSETIYEPSSINETREIFYDQEKHIIKANNEERMMLPDTQDPLSMLHFLRSQDFKKGEVLDLNVNTNQKNYRFLTKVDKKQSFSVNGTKVSAVSLEIDIKRRNKTRRNSTQMTVWLTNDDKNTPFLIKVFTSGLFLVLRLN